MEKWYEKVNQYAATAYYLSFAETVYDQLNEVIYKEGARIFLDNAWTWLRDHSSFSPDEMYYLVAGGPTIAQTQRALLSREPLPPESPYENMGEWSICSDDDRLQAMWNMVIFAGCSAVYQCFRFHNLGAPQDVDLPHNILDEYWNRCIRDFDLVDSEKSEKVMAWLQTNYPPGTEEKPLEREEIMALF